MASMPRLHRISPYYPPLTGKDRGKEASARLSALFAKTAPQTPPQPQPPSAEDVFALGQRLESGTDGQPDALVALDYYRLAAGLGHQRALECFAALNTRRYNEAINYSLGRDGYEVDISWAVTLLVRCAHDNNSDAQFLVGWLYDESRSFFKMPEGGDLMAQVRFALSSFEPEVTMFDNATAKAWYQRAALNGSEHAKKRLRFMEYQEFAKKYKTFGVGPRPHIQE